MKFVFSHFVCLFSVLLFVVDPVESHIKEADGCSFSLKNPPIRSQSELLPLSTDPTEEEEMTEEMNVKEVDSKNSELCNDSSKPLQIAHIGHVTPKPGSVFCFLLLYHSKLDLHLPILCCIVSLLWL